jgi:hypothetical protein
MRYHNYVRVSRSCGVTELNRRNLYLSVLLAPLLALQIWSLVYYVHERQALDAYLNQVTTPTTSASLQLQDIVLSLRTKPDNGNDSYFLLPFFSFLRPTPLQVIENGGDCADRSRLVIALLRRRGISASKWALYNPKGESVHAVVQADVETGEMVADPLFGIWFPKPDGGYYDIAELRGDPNILAQRVRALRAEGLEPGADHLEGYNFSEYAYTNARTINWKKSPLMFLTYRLLRKLMGTRVDELHRPAFVEEPPLMVIYGAAAIELFIILTWLLLERVRIWRTQKQINRQSHHIESKRVQPVPRLSLD